MSLYGKSEYWEERYNKDIEPFDWYQRYVGLKEILTNNLDKEHRILHLGAGNSRLPEEMLEDGYNNLTSIDASSVCSKAMIEKYKEREVNIKYSQMDAKSLQFGQANFDAIIDKAMLDSILCGDNSTVNANKAISEAYRVLDKNGVYIIVSYGQPEYRMIYLQKPEFEWTVKVTEIPKPTTASSISIGSDDKASFNVHYVYVCRKGEKAA